MSELNPIAVTIVAFCTVIGAIFGAWLIGCAVGLGLVLIESYRQS